MKYLCLIAAERVMEQMSDDEARAHYDEYRDYIAAIRASGHYVACNRLLPPGTVTTVRMRQGRVSTVDGPYVETKEVVGGVYVIEADSYDHAVKLCENHPNFRFGSIEVREVDFMGGPEE